jgi:hypothetical protein
VPLNAGILIIGSLLWDERRCPWRDARLDMTSAQTATVRLLNVGLVPEGTDALRIVWSSLSDAFWDGTSSLDTLNPKL